MRVNRVQGSYLRASKSCDVVGGVLLNIRERTRPGLRTCRITRSRPIAPGRRLSKGCLSHNPPERSAAPAVASRVARTTRTCPPGMGVVLRNDQDLIAAVNGLEEKSPNAPASEGRQRTFPPEAPFPDLPDGIARSRLVNGEYVRERDEHVFSGTSGVR